MSDELPEVHVAALAWTRGRVAAIRPEQWGDPTPCEDWDLRTLVNHIVSGNWWAAELAAGKTIDEVGDRLDGDVLGDDAIAAYDISAADASAVFRAPGAMERACAVSYGPVPGEVYCGHRLIDVLVHGWDVAKATGGDSEMPADLVEVCLAVVEPQAEALAGSGAFHTDVPVEDGAPPSTRLLAFLGRRP